MHHQSIDWEQIVASLPLSSPGSVHLSSDSGVDIAEVIGSNPVPPTIFTRDSSGDMASLIRLVEALLGPEGHRRLMMRQLTNDELFRARNTGVPTVSYVLFVKG